jgi:hypothetical protein
MQNFIGIQGLASLRLSISDMTGGDGSCDYSLFGNRQQIAIATSTRVATTSKRRSDIDVLQLIRSPYKVVDGDRKTRNLLTTRAAMLRYQSFDWSGGKARLIFYR